MSPAEPRTAPPLLGQEEALRTLEAAALSGRLHHTWLFCGPRGIGKASAAFRFAAWLLSGQPRAPAGQGPLWLPPASPVLRRVAAGAHPDLLALAPDEEAGRRRTIKVEAVRAARQFLALTPAEGGYRCLIVDEAEAMEAPAANTLLKTLEEPPPRTIIILLSHAPGRLLPTIRSRCRRLDFFPLPEGLLASLLDSWQPGAGALAPLAGGSPGRALALMAAEGLELARLAEEALAGGAGPEAAHALADRLAGREAGAAFATFFDLLARAVESGVRAAAAGQGGPGWVARRPLAAWAEASVALRRMAMEAERLSLDRRQAVIAAMATLRGG
ncbi:MAG: DNA polymerase III subunit delta' [Roseococcus sp.]|nr:DNA polymerase III subunit delta' [Roseococcus sp.]